MHVYVGFGRPASDLDDLIVVTIPGEICVGIPANTYYQVVSNAVLLDFEDEHDEFKYQ